MILVKNQNRPSEQVSKFRLYLMRGLYLLTFIGLAFQTWETILFPSETLDYITGVAFSFWAAYATLMGLGIRYPIKMLPLLLLQLFYKATWALGVYLPMQAASQVTPEAESFFWICIVAVILDVIVIPWPYVFKNYIRNFLNLKIHPE
jgi:hypothetical protein